MNGFCEWKEDVHGIRFTECGEILFFDSTVVKSKEYGFCCFCGKEARKADEIQLEAYLEAYNELFVRGFIGTQCKNLSISQLQRIVEILKEGN